ncbi:MAG: elongation factor Ts [Dehalococcoidia bacterium]
MVVTTEIIRDLRAKTGAGVMDCKKALEESNGDMNGAISLLKEWGISAVQKKSSRSANQGVVETYVHAGGRIGVILELNCETDFVARTPEFLSLAHDLALQIASMDPQSIDDENTDSSSEDFDGETRLMHQDFVKDPSQTISDLITEAVSRIGENILVRRFTRYELGKS